MAVIDLTGRFRVRGYGGVAFYCVGYAQESVPLIGLCIDEDGNEYEGETDEYEDVDDTSRVVCIMVGDDHKFTFDIDDLTPLRPSEYCHECGQIGCKWHCHDDEEDE